MNYPTGYGSANVSMSELKRQYSGDMEPEFARRLFAWIASKDGAVGIGSGWRPNPSNVSAASRAGKSFHQTQTFGDGSRFFCAVDLVVATADKHSSGAVPVNLVPLQGSTAAKEFGVHVNVGKPGESGFESWHMQPIEIDGFDAWANSGRIRPAAGRVVPGDPRRVKQPAVVGGELGFFAPAFGAYGLYPLNPNKAEVGRASGPRPDDLVKYLQGVMTNRCRLSGLDIDGLFDARTEECVIAVQSWNGLEQTGRCDSATWTRIDAYAAT